MTRALRRLTAIVGLVAVHLSLVSGAAACEDANSGAYAGAAETMPTAVGTGADHHCSTPDEGPPAPARGAHHCISMLACGSPGVAPARVALVATTGTMPDGVAGVSERTPSSSAAAPEVPPPKA